MLISCKIAPIKKEKMTHNLSLIIQSKDPKISESVLLRLFILELYKSIILKQLFRNKNAQISFISDWSSIVTKHQVI